MPLNPKKSRRTAGRQNPKPARGARGAARTASGLKLPHERDGSNDTVADEPDPVMIQAKRDIDAGLVDTDMRATPGLDAERRNELVPGPGGKSPPSGA